MRTFGRFLKQYGWTTLLFVALVIALMIMSQILQNASEFADAYSALLFASWFGIAVLLGLFIKTLWSLYSKLKKKVPGTKITIRLSLLATLLMGIPAITIFAFSMNFIQQGITQWFDVKTETALGNAAELVRYTLDNKTRESLNLTTSITREQSDLLASFPITGVSSLRRLLNAEEVALYQTNQQLVAFSSRDNAQILPKPPGDNLFQQIRQKTTYAAIEESEDGFESFIRILIPFNDNFNNDYALQAIFLIPKNITEMADSVAIANSQYLELSYLKGPLTTSFTLILTMVVLLTIVTAILFSIRAIDNFTQPIRVLTRGTRAVSKGDYNIQMPVRERDEFGELILSFNDMIEKISKARNDLRISHQQTEVQKLYLQGVIQNLSSGVITFDSQQTVRSMNEAAEQILNCRFEEIQNATPTEIANRDTQLHEAIRGLFSEIEPKFANKKKRKHWELRFDYHCKQAHKILMLHGTSLSAKTQNAAGYVLLIDDITELVQAQLNKAWSDVARRLAHEIKNPLTPIQLSAERLNFKLSRKLDGEDLDLLNRMTNTITDQVSAMQKLVQAFSDYAKPPEVHLQPTELNSLLTSISDMYQNSQWKFDLDLIEPAPQIMADLSRLRQLFHNLIKNALEACDNQDSAWIRLSTHLLDSETYQITLCDNGRGMPEEAQNWIFEPYATDKPKGTGLGLAIVRKIIDEHRGTISVKTSPNEGTCFIINLPIITPAMTPNTLTES